MLMFGDNDNSNQLLGQPMKQTSIIRCKLSLSSGAFVAGPALW